MLGCLVGLGRIRAGMRILSEGGIALLYELASHDGGVSLVLLCSALGVRYVGKRSSWPANGRGAGREAGGWGGSCRASWWQVVSPGKAQQEGRFLPTRTCEGRGW